MTFTNQDTNLASDHVTAETNGGSRFVYCNLRTWPGKIQRRSWRGVKNRLASLTLAWHCLDLRREEGRVSSRAPPLRLMRIPLFTTKAIPFFFT